jgi:hypothetical protein
MENQRQGIKSGGPTLLSWASWYPVGNSALACGLGAVEHTQSFFFGSPLYSVDRISNL